MENKYYYLEGIERLGPYSAEEIKARKLRPETLILKAGNNDWVPLERFAELADEIKVILKIQEEKEEDINSQAEKGEKPEGKLKISKIFIWLIGILICLTCSYAYVNFQKSQDLTSFNQKIDLVFEGKSSISDFDIKGAKGELFDVKLSSFSEYYFKFDGSPQDEKKIVHTSKHYIVSKDDHNLDAERWKYLSKLVEYFEAEKYSGFSIYKLNKYSDRFSLTYSWSGDMAYRVKEFKILPGYKSEYFSTPDTKVPTYRSSIYNAYEGAAKFLTVENEDNSYLKGSLSRISEFPYLKSEFHKIEQDFPKYFYSSDTVFVQFKDYTSHEIETQKISKNTSRYDANVFTDDWIVWYKDYTNTYFISEIKDVFYKRILLYFFISSILFSVIFFLIIKRKKIEVV